MRGYKKDSYLVTRFSEDNSEDPEYWDADFLDQALDIANQVRWPGYLVYLTDIEAQEMYGPY